MATLHKRVGALLLAAVMILTFCPVLAGAEEAYTVKWLDPRESWPSYSYTGAFVDGLLVVSAFGGYAELLNGIINTDGEFVVPITSDYSIGSYANGLFVVSQYGKEPDANYNYPFETSGIIDKTGKFVLPMTNEFEIVDNYYEDGYPDNLFVVSKKVGDTTLYGAIDKTGKIIIPIEHTERLFFNEGLSSATKIVDGVTQIGVLDLNGKIVMPYSAEYSRIYTSEGYIRVENEEYWAVMDKAGNFIVPFDSKYSYIGYFQDGLAVAYGSNGYGAINTAGELLFTLPEDYNIENGFRDGIALVSKSENVEESEEEKYLCGLINATGKIIIPLTDEYYYWPLSEGLAASIKTDGDNSLWGVVDETGKTVIPNQYSYIEGFVDGFSIVRQRDANNPDKELCGVIDKTGKIVVPLGEFEQIHGINEGVTLVRTYYDDETGYKNGVLHFNNASEPAAPAQPLIATPTSAKVQVNGATIDFDAYTINGQTYYQIADIARSVSGTTKQFSAAFKDGAIYVTRGTAMSGSISPKGTGNKTPTPTQAKIYIDGVETAITAYTMDGHTYYQMKAVAEAFNFAVGFANGTITVDTSKSYGA
ncbi:MAG: WG repeat-containing protein, partial [Oscillospiraceae bacterium]|nr:WG repeat-containing protein [Oscillospiraceae bacterium]